MSGSGGLVALMAVAGTSEWAQRSLDFFTLRYAFAADALLMAVVVGATCGLVGTFLVLRGMSLIGDATGHATLPGVCVAFMLTGTKQLGALLAGALVSGIAATALVGWLSAGRRTRPDAAIGIVLSTAFGVGVVLLSSIQASPTGAQSGLSSFLFGSAAAVSRTQLVSLLIVASVVAIGVVLAARVLTLATFDPTFAESVGVPTRHLQIGLLVALSVAVVVSIQAVGVVLVSAMLIIPPSAALLLCRRVSTTMATSAAIGALSGAVGAWMSFVRAGLPTGPSMVVVAGCVLLIALVVDGVRRRQRKRRLPAIELAQ